ncbi:ABC transporter permease subunit, partial [Trebonia sp.]
MIRFGMLQFRIQAITAAVTLAAFTILLAATGPHLASMYAADGLDSCHGSSCLSMATYFTASLARSPYDVVFLLSTGIILLAPAVIGLFWGAPLIARELETGTATLAWNQSVTRTRWLAVKLVIGGLTAMAVTEALCLMQTWWAVPISQAVADGSGVGVAQSRFSQLNFATHGITPLGYAAFAFALGVAAGALIRRTVPAMAVTLAIFAALQVAMPLWVRPNLAPPDRT